MVQVAVDAKGCHSPDNIGHLEVVAFRWSCVSCVVVPRDLSNERVDPKVFQAVWLAQAAITIIIVWMA